MKVSVVIPVYNAERYLSQCIDSVRNQTFSNWELLLVNDGSSDSSEQICRTYCEKDHRIHLITQKNGGPAKAIGTGIENAQGKYLMFLDADDWYEPEMLKVMTSSMEESDSDAVLCGYWKVYPDGRRILGNPVPAGIMSEEQIEDQILTPFYEKTGNIYQFWSAARWDKIYRTELLKTVYSAIDPSLSMGEDLEMNLRYLSACRKIQTLGTQVLYDYRIGDPSLARGYSERMAQQYQQRTKAISALAREQNRPFAARAAFEDSGTMSMLYELKHTGNLSRKEKEDIRKMLISQLHDPSLKYKLFLYEDFPGKETLQKLYRKIRK